MTTNDENENKLKITGINTTKKNENFIKKLPGKRFKVIERASKTQKSYNFYGKRLLTN